MGGIIISGRIKQSFYPRTRHGELKVISMIYAPPYLIRRSVAKVKSIARAQHHPTVTPVAHKTVTMESKQRCTTITTEQHNNKEGNTRHGNAVRTYRRERLLTV